jgi:hypothetical protein
MATKKPSAMMASMSSSLVCISKALAVRADRDPANMRPQGYTTRLRKRRKKREGQVLDFRGFVACRGLVERRGLCRSGQSA